MELIDGKTVSKTIKEEIKQEVEKIKQEGGKIPHLAAVLIGHNPASETYVASKVKTCEQIGFKSTQIRREDAITEQELLDIIDTCNADDDIDGILVQLPLPGHISEQRVIEHIDYRKDVDGFHPVNIGKMVAGMPAFVSATPAGILELLKRYEIQTEGKHCVVLGRSNIVGTPVSILMSRKSYPGNSTVTVCHSRTQNLKEITSQADILIAAIGKKEFVTADMVKEGAVVIDVGIHREKSTVTKSGWKLRGDVKFDEVSKKCRYITPVPGGVGPMTIAALMMNTLKASKQKNIS
jgi:methylenetetrahydrofolate dehydrogenase (NADP+) / methenyltetrahydrofolate cyclohydrolase